MEPSLGRSVSFGPFRLYPGARLLERDGKRVALGSRALDVLIVLVDSAGQVVSQRELMERVWRDLVVSPGNLRVHVGGLRRALGDEEAQSRYVANVPGLGYTFVAPIHRDAGDEPGTIGSEATMEGAARLVPACSTVPPPHNLPHQRTSFIGREKELKELQELLSTVRLVTITGSGGCGKTRLAMQLATRVLHDFPQGCWLVELAPLEEPTLVAQTVAKALSIHEQVDGPLPSVIAERLANKHLLLLIDNAEHLVEATAQLVDLLLRRCGDVKILATSREPLNVSGELTYRIPSLSLPVTGAVKPDAILACEAGQLFVERARLSRLDFDVTTKNAQTVGSICRRLDGIALALELAAPCLRTMTVQELSRYLDDRFAPLIAAPREAVSRHRTLRALIDWSHEQLSTAEKIVLRRVAVFSGGWVTEQAEAVCVGDGVDRYAVRGLLTSLTDKSLLISEAREHVSRFRMLETVRQYALERLRDAGEEAELRSLHLQVFKDMAAALKGQSEAARLVLFKQIDCELDNVRAALMWCEAHRSRAVVGLEMADCLGVYWYGRGQYAEARGWIERVLAISPEDIPSKIRVRALSVVAALTYEQGEFARAAAYWEDALAGYRQLGHRPNQGAMLLNLGAVAYCLGDYPKAERLYEEALAIALEAGVPRFVVKRMHNVGHLAAQLDEIERANDVLERCLSVSRQAGNSSIALTFSVLGWIRHRQHRDQEALEMLSEAVRLFREAGESGECARALYYLGMVNHDLRDTASAKANLQEALASRHARESRHHTAEVLDAFGSLVLEVAGPLDAARIWGHAERLREDIGAPQTPLNRRRCERQINETRQSAAALGFDAAWHEGRAMTRDAAVALALSL